MEKQQALEKVNTAYEQVNMFIRKYPHASATGGTGFVSLLTDTLFFHTNLYGLAFGVAVTYGVWQWGQRDILGRRERVVDSTPPMGRINQQRSEYTFKERLARLFDPNADGPNQPIHGIVKEDRYNAQETVSDRQEAVVLPVESVQVPQATNERHTAGTSSRFPEPQDMAEIIEHGFRPSRESILLMNTINGYATEKISKLHHIGLGGSSGRGKTNTTRLITSQLLACGAKVYMVNPNFAPIKHNGNRLEDWRPIAAKLQEPVARNADDIERLLNHFMKTFEERREREQLTPKRGADLFLVLGEWPVIVEECPDAVKIIGRLLRQARQYGIHVIAEFQDALIETIKGNSGTRANYGTAYFFGGDVTTAKTLLSLPDGVKIDNTGLGDKGAVYLKSFSSQAVPGRVPFFSNKALYMLLGCIGESVTDELVDEDEFYEDEEDLEDYEDEGLSEQEQIYEDALKVWARGVRSTRGMQEALRIDFDEAQELLEEMSNLGLITWRSNVIAESASVMPVPIIPEKGRLAEEVPIEAAIVVYNSGSTSRYQLAKAFGLSENQGRKLKEIIESMAGE